jgi:hypothetical protein
MKFTILTDADRRAFEMAKYSAWHKKFAWVPVRMSNDPTAVIWFEFYLRKGRVTNYSSKKLQWDWESVESSFDILKMDR